MPIRYVYFDVGGTLIDPRPSVGQVYRDVGRVHGLETSADALEDAFRRAYQPHVEAQGRQAMTLPASESENLDWWRKLVFRVLDDVEFGGDREALFQGLFAAFSDKDAWRVYGDVRPTIDALERRGLPMGVLSNWDFRLPALLDALDLSRHFRPVLVSAIEQLAKPDPRFFQLAVQRAGVRPEEVLYVGDHVALDLDPALDLRIDAYLIDRKGESDSPRAVRSLEALLGRL